MKKIITVIAALTLLMGLCSNVYAQNYTDIVRDESADWLVYFNGEELVSNFKTSVLSDKVTGLQPGDEQTFTLRLRNDYQETADFWMTNEVLQSLEDTRTMNGLAGGGYTYELTYTGPGAAEPQILFSSETVGGDVKAGEREGLHEATSGLENYFYLDTLKKGDEGQIKLVVALDGETQGNDYQDTLAKLQMNFAVELNPDTTPTPTPTGTATPTPTRTTTNRTTVVKTGDDTNKLPYYLGLGGGGLVVLFLAIYLTKKRKDEKKEEAA